MATERAARRRSRCSPRLAHQDAVHLDRLLTALHLPRPDRLARDARSRGYRGGARDDLAALGLALQALSDVHGIADHRVLEPATAADRAGHDLSGVHADPDVQAVDRVGPPALGVQLGLPALHRDRAL